MRAGHAAHSSSVYECGDRRQVRCGCPAPTEIETGTITGGFAHELVFALAEPVVNAVKSGAIRKFVVMAGCDGRHKSREYYAEFAKRKEAVRNFKAKASFYC